MFHKDKVLQLLSTIQEPACHNFATLTRKSYSAIDDDDTELIEPSEDITEDEVINENPTIAASVLFHSTSNPTPQIWNEIMDTFENERNEILQYKLKKNPPCILSQQSTIQYMRSQIFSLLENILQRTIQKAIDTGSLNHEKSPFNGIDFIAEQLWTLNTQYPLRKDDNLNIHDMDWAKEYLVESPRPFFPLSWIWSNEYAAIKIQAYLRAYWVRRRTDVQEMRIFWKEIKAEKLIDWNMC